ncbi:MAG: M15 family metallopeptidase [Shewanella sp.]
MSETLGQKQRRFTRMTAELIKFAYDNGYELTFGDAYRDPRLHGDMGIKKGYGHASSNHKQRLAVDFNLFKDGKFLTSTEDHRPLGEFWESIGGSWGGRFNDGNHYSIEHNGVK